MDKLSRAIEQANEKRAKLRQQAQNTGEAPEGAPAASQDNEAQRGSSDVSSVTIVPESVASEESGGSLLAERYEILELMGSGGLGELFRAHDHKSRQDVAIKIPFATVIGGKAQGAAFLEQIGAIAQCASAHLVPILDHRVEGDRCLLVMPILLGQSLRSYLQTLGALQRTVPMVEALHLIDQICDGLRALPPGSFHGDLKPENIWLTDAGTAKIMDAGLATLVPPRTLTQTMIKRGVPAYLAPEQLQGRSDVDSAADQYAMAAMLHEMLTGVVPVDANDIITSRRKDIPRVVSDAISRAMQALPQDRFADIRAWKQGLRATVAAKSDSVIDRVHMLENRQKVGAVAAVVVLLVGVGLWSLHKPAVDLGEQASPLVTEAMRNEAQHSFETVQSLLQTLDQKSQDLAANVKDTRANSDRLIDAIAQAANDRQRKLIAQQLAASRIAADIAQTMDRMGHQLVFDTDALATVRAQLQEGAMMIRDGRVAQARDLLSAAQSDGQRLLSLLDGLQPLMEEQRRAVEQTKATAPADADVEKTDEMAEETKKLRLAEDTLRLMEKAQASKAADSKAQPPTPPPAAVSPPVSSPPPVAPVASSETPSPATEPSRSPAAEPPKAPVQATAMLVPPSAVAAAPAAKGDPLVIPPTVDAKNCQKPHYPDTAIWRRHVGDVILRFDVDIDGTAKDIVIAQSSGSELLDKASIDAATHCLFRPGTVNGVPQKASSMLHYHWEIED